MSDYDYAEREPTEEEQAALESEYSARQNQAITITGLQTSDVEFMVRQAVERALDYRMTERMERILKEKVEEVVDAKAKALTEDIVEREVAKVLEEGWTEHDKWGNKGKTHHLKELIAGYLTKENHDSYHRENNGTPVERAIRKVVSETVDKEFKPVVEAAKKKLAEQLDATVLASVAETVRTALGLKR